MHDFGLHGFGMGFIFWVIILLILFIIFYQLKEKGSNTKVPSAKDILDRRYANGEIDTAEYHERLNEIQSTHKDDNDLFSKD
jgi:putative membrane protein